MVLTQADLDELVGDKLPDGTQLPSADLREVEVAQNQSIFDQKDLLQTKINAILKFIPKNRGFIDNVVPGQSSGTITIGGDITSVNVVSHTTPENWAGFVSTTYTVTLTNTMETNNYYVEADYESNGIISSDNNGFKPTFKVISPTEFQISIQKSTNPNNTMNLKVHLRAISLD